MKKYLENAKNLMKEVASEFKKFLKMRKGEYQIDISLEKIKKDCGIKESEEIPNNFFNTHDVIIYPSIKNDLLFSVGILASSDVCEYQNNTIPRIGLIKFDLDTLISY